MSVSSEMRALVRHRAHFACEYCGIRENDVRGEFTIDHYQPKSKGGSDDSDNLVYCCIWCNQHKLAYWPEHDKDVPLWNPRQSPSTEHFLLLDNGELHPISAIGSFTIQRLGLNGSALIAYRIRHRYLNEYNNQLTHCQELLSLQEKFIAQLTALVQEQHSLLTEQQTYIELLLKRHL